MNMIVDYALILDFVKLTQNKLKMKTSIEILCKVVKLWLWCFSAIKNFEHIPANFLYVPELSCNLLKLRVPNSDNFEMMF